MYLWLIFLVLFSIIWCPGAVAMHLTPVNLTKQQSSQQQQQRYISGDGGVLNYSSSSSSSSRSNSRSSNSNNNKASRSELDQKLLTTHLHQITNNSHHNNHPYYNSWMLSPSSVSSLPLSQTPSSSSLPLPTQPDSKRTNEIARWRHRMNEKRARIRAHRRSLLLGDAQNLRNRRESLANTLSHHRQQSTFRQEREHKRYCSARDPAVLAFEAPTVFEGKIKSMSHNRQGPYSVTFECVHVYKQPAGFVIPPKVRLRFETTDNRTECDIYRQEFKQRGPIRGDVLEQGKLYFLFVKQIDVGNFTILGQPIRKTKKTEKEVRLGASSNYGE